MGDPRGGGWGGVGWIRGATVSCEDAQFFYHNDLTTPLKDVSEGGRAAGRQAGAAIVVRILLGLTLSPYHPIP